MSKKLGKRARLTLVGEDTEVDKTIVDGISDPIMHIVRNSMDHGLEETEAERVAAGKDPVGEIILSARHTGSEVIIEIHDDGGGVDCDAVLAKAPDVITYVEHGVCDLGVVGKDTILEKGGAFYEVLDLGFGRCRFALAVRKGTDFYGTYKTRRVASKYPNVTRAFFEGKGMDVDIIKIEGSVELAPILDLADGIVDIVETGATLKENGLEPIEDVAQVSARLIVNTASILEGRT